MMFRQNTYRHIHNVVSYRAIYTSLLNLILMFSSSIINKIVNITRNKRQD